MAGYNKVILLGNLTRDPQLKYLPNNTAVCEFGMAVNRRWRDRDGNQQEDVCFVELTAFGRQAETLNQYMSKGRQLMIDGRLKFDSWTSQDGQKRNKLSVVIENFQFVGDRGDGGSRGGYSPSAPQREEAYGSGGRREPQQQQERYPAGEDDAGPSGDDIPF